MTILERTVIQMDDKSSSRGAVQERTEQVKADSISDEDRASVRQMQTNFARWHGPRVANAKLGRTRGKA